jgi:hypothetical protein
MVAGSAAPVVFGLLVWLAFPVYGVVLGTVIAIGAASIVSLTVASLLRLTLRH